AVLAPQGVEAVAELLHLFGRMADAVPAVAQPRGPPQRRLALAADDDRRVRLRVRLGLELHRREVVVLAVKLGLRLGPQDLEDLDDLVGAGAARVVVLAGDLELLFEPAGADP